MDKIAKTGKDKKWATVLYLICREFQSKTVFELGSCAGISAIYLSSPKSVENLITVEGSEKLAEIAERSLEPYDFSHVVNKHFDDSIDSELPNIDSKIDFAFIDGHHEKNATIHYFNKLLPYLDKGGVVVFDDISWSQDMRNAWKEIKKKDEFSHTIDLGKIGVCIIKASDADSKNNPKEWDLRSIVGHSGIGSPHGWK